MVLSTVADGAAQARTVILREVQAEPRELIFFTDARSAKVAQMQAQPMGSLLCWSADIGWQLRLRVRLEVQTSGLRVSSRWAHLKLTPAAQDYLSPLPPGSARAQAADPNPSAARATISPWSRRMSRRSTGSSCMPKATAVHASARMARSGCSHRLAAVHAVGRARLEAARLFGYSRRVADLRRPVHWGPSA